MSPRTTTFSFLLLIALVASAKTPCDPNDPTSLCLKPLRKSSPTATNSENTIPSSVINSRQRRGRGGRRAGGAIGGGVIGGVIGAGAARRPRPGRGGGFDDDDFDDDDDDVDGDGDDEGDDGFCFPANTLVTVQGKGLIKLSDLAIGDSVMVAGGAFSQVYVFGHRLTRGRFPFIKITTNDGQLTASHGHYVYANGHLVTAGSVQKGHTLELANGQTSSVTAVENVVAEGLYNPHTLAGELVVNGFRVSAYTKTVQPIVAKSMLAPLRAAFRMLGIDVTAGAMSSTAPKFLLNRLPKGAVSTGL